MHRENCDQHHRFPKSLTKREIKCVNAKIEELDFEGSIYDWTFLPDELIESGLSNFAGAVLSRVNAGVFPGSGAIQSHDKPHGLAVPSQEPAPGSGRGCGTGTRSCQALPAAQRSHR